MQLSQCSLLPNWTLSSRSCSHLGRCTTSNPDTFRWSQQSCFILDWYVFCNIHGLSSMDCSPCHFANFDSCNVSHLSSILSHKSKRFPSQSHPSSSSLSGYSFVKSYNGGLTKYKALFLKPYFCWGISACILLTFLCFFSLRWFRRHFYEVSLK